jgi:hypothetical protein
MPYTSEEGGRLNNFAIEPKVYRADAPSPEQKRNYVIMGIGGTLLVGMLVFVAYSVSNLG